MKNKILMRITTALFAALILMGGFSIPAYANGGGEATNDSNVKTEEKKEEKTPLTPDGNMSLVDNVKGDAAKDKEFIIVKSKGGNYFYIVIDHAAQGENTVHFLNQVDEKDLLSIIGIYQVAIKGSRISSQSNSGYANVMTPGYYAPHQERREHLE